MYYQYIQEQTVSLKNFYLNNYHAINTDLGVISYYYFYMCFRSSCVILCIFLKFCAVSVFGLAVLAPTKLIIKIDVFIVNTTIILRTLYIRLLSTYSMSAVFGHHHYHHHHHHHQADFTSTYMEKNTAVKNCHSQLMH